MPVLGSASVLAARAALAAQRQGKYEAFHAAMMGTKGQITEDTVERIAESVGLRARFRGGPQVLVTPNERPVFSRTGPIRCCARVLAVCARQRSRARVEGVPGAAGPAWMVATARGPYALACVIGALTTPDDIFAGRGADSPALIGARFRVAASGLPDYVLRLRATDLDVSEPPRGFDGPQRFED
jgi:hypothetical protein